MDMSNTALRNLVSVSEAVEILASRPLNPIERSEDAIKWYCRNEHLKKTIKIGRAWRIDRRELLTFVPPEVGNPKLRKNVQTCS